MTKPAALATAAAAISLGIAGDVLLRRAPWGLNVPVWTMLFLAVAIALFVRFRPQEPVQILVPALGAITAAAGIAWRDSRVLVTLDVILWLVFLLMLAAGPRNVRLAATGLARIAGALALTIAQAIAGFFQLLFDDIEWRALPRGGRKLGVLFRGVAIALPALLVFGVLLANADAAFARLLGDMFQIDAVELVRHTLMTLFIAGICAGFLHSFLAGSEMPSPERPPGLRLPTAEVNVALALINILFALFVMIQARYLFGRAKLPDMSYSDYARRGFFELVWVVVLVMPMLLLIEWLIDKERMLLFRVLATIQIALVLAIAYSAYVRMQLYRAEFGLTQLRYYCTAFMFFIGALLVFFALTVLTGHRERFAIVAIATSIVTLVALHAHNPDLRILETNIARARAGTRPLDVRYGVGLSDDAAPLIHRNADLFPDRELAMFVHRRRPRGWRTWNWSREQARRYESNATPPSGRE